MRASSLGKAGLVAALALAASAWVATTSPPLVPVAHAMAWTIGGEYRGSGGVRFQEGPTDCGVAVLSMILDDHVRVPRLEEDRRRVLERGYGLSLLEMREIGRRHGLRAAGWRMDFAGLMEARLPAIAHFDNHYVVVDRILADGTVRIRDPAVGRVELSRSSFERLWTGHLLLFAPPSPAASSPSAARR